MRADIKLQLTSDPHRATTKLCECICNTNSTNSSQHCLPFLLRTGRSGRHSGRAVSNIQALILPVNATIAACADSKDCPIHWKYRPVLADLACTLQYRVLLFSAVALLQVAVGQTVPFAFAVFVSLCIDFAVGRICFGTCFGAEASLDLLAFVCFSGLACLPACHIRHACDCGRMISNTYFYFLCICFGCYDVVVRELVVGI